MSVPRYRFEAISIELQVLKIQTRSAPENTDNKAFWSVFSERHIC